MIDIYHCTVAKELTVQQWKKYFSDLPLIEKERSNQYKRWQDRHAHLFARLMLRRGLQRYGYNEDILDYIQVTRYNRPFLDDHTDFSISHSGRYVVCALGRNVRLGVDIELKNEQFDIESCGDIFHQGEREYLRHSPDKCDAIFRIWSRKESIIKADGRGLLLTLNQINCVPDEIMLDNNKWFIATLPLHNDYSVALCANVPRPVINYFPVNFYD